MKKGEKHMPRQNRAPCDRSLLGRPFQKHTGLGAHFLLNSLKGVLDQGLFLLYSPVLRKHRAGGTPPPSQERSG